MTDWKSSEDDRKTRNAALALSGVAITATLLVFAAEPFPLSTGVAQLRIVVVLWNIALLFLLWKKTGARAARFAFVVSLLPELATFWALKNAHVAMGLDFEPLVRQRYIFIIVALLAPPPVWMGTTILIAILAEALGEYWFGGLSQRRLFEHEPWLTIAMAVLAVVVLVIRVRSIARERVLLQRVAELSHEARMTQMTLAVRDLTNSPLQILWLQVELLERSVPGAGRFVVPMKRAIVRLAELNRTLRSYDLGNDGDRHASLDSIHVLERTRGGSTEAKGRGTGR